jgi:hypothetical protein
LERRLGELQLEEGERRRAAELRLVRSELELDSLAAKAAEAERAEAEAVFLGRSGLPQRLRAGIADAELALREAQEEEAKRPPGIEDQRYLEWYRMLNEDKPEQFALSIMEASCDNWEQSLLDLLSPVAFKSALRCAEGLDRLDAELHDFAANDRAQNATSAECLQALSEEGPWRLVFAELQEAYTLVSQLRARNDSLAGQIAALRWRRSGTSASALPTSLPNSPAKLLPKAEPSPLQNLPPGPKFSAPVLPWLVPQNADSKAQEQEETQLKRPPEPTSEPSRPRREVVHQPVLATEEKGIGYLCGRSNQRFRPGMAMHLGFESAWGSDAQANMGPTMQKAGVLPQQHGRVMGPAELASIAAAAFKEPLSSAVGTSSMPSPPPRQAAPVKQKCSDWVTFDSHGSRDLPATAPTFPSDSGFAPLDTVPSAFTDPGMQNGFASAPQPQNGFGFGFEAPDEGWEKEGSGGWHTSGNVASDWADDAEFQAPTNFGFIPQARSEDMIPG